MKEKIIGLIPVRLASKRLPNKCYFDINGEIILERLVKKAKKAGIRLKDIFLCTSDDKSCKKLSSIAIEKKINVLTGDEDFPLKRIWTRTISCLSQTREIYRSRFSRFLAPKHFDPLDSNIGQIKL